VKNGDFPRSKPVDQVIEEIRILTDLGFDAIFFVDDHFAGNRGYAKELLAGIIEIMPSLPIQPYFYTQTTLNVAEDDELLALFRDANFRRLFIGVETDNSLKLKELNKTHNLRMNMKDAIAKIQSYGITVWAGIMFGLDDDDAASFEAQYKFICETGITPVQIGLLQAVPGTPLYIALSDNERIRDLSSVIGAAALGDQQKGYASNIIAKGMNEEEINRQFAKVLRLIFEPSVYLKRILLTDSRSSSPPLSTLPPVNWSYIKIIARTAFYYLIKADSGQRSMFLKTLFAILTGHVKNVDEVLFHVVIYKHLRTMYNNLADLAESAEITASI